MKKILMTYGGYVCVVLGGIAGYFLGVLLHRLVWPADQYTEAMQWGTTLETLPGIVGWVIGTISVVGWFYLRSFRGLGRLP